MSAERQLLEEVLILIQERVPNIKSLSADTVLIGMNEKSFDSLSVLRLIFAVEKKFKIQISIGEINQSNFESPRAISIFLQNKLKSAS